MGKQTSTQAQIFSNDTVVVGPNVTASMSAVAGLTVVGSVSTTGSVFFNIPIVDKTVIAALSASSTVNYDLDTQTVLYYTGNSSSNWTLNFRGTSTVPLSTRLSLGTTIKADFIATNGSQAYACSAITIDDQSTAITWLSGSNSPSSTWPAGNANSTEVYSFSIMKVASTTFRVVGTLQGYW